MLFHLLNPGHTACPGCGQLIAARHVINTCGKNTIIANATGCLEVTTSKHPTSSWKVPWIHSLFENPAAVGTGIQAALKQKGLDKKNESKDDLNESTKEIRLLKSLKRNQFPEKWTLLDMVNRYEDEIWEYLWYDKGYHYDYGDSK